MKAQIVLIFALLFQLCLSIATDKYSLKIKNGDGGDKIVLQPGIFTKLTLVLSSEEGEDFNYEEDERKYKLTFVDEKIKAIHPEIILCPQESLVYTTYVGLPCSESIEGEEYNIKISVEPDNEKTDDGSIIYDEETKVQISKVKADIKLDLLLSSMAQLSKNFFKLENELYNVDDISISLDGDTLADFNFENILISSFSGRSEISANCPSNHGILFDSTFFPTKVLEAIKYNFKLKLDAETTGKCFNLVKSDFNFDLKTDGLVDLDANVKAAIVYNTEDNTPIYDASAKIKLSTVIPIAPVILECQFSLNSTFSGNSEEGALQTTIDENTSIFKTIVTSTGKIDINMDNLEANTEYFVQCQLSNTDSIEEKIKSIIVKIGDFDASDVIKKLIPSRDPNATSQCAEFTLKDTKQALFFFGFGPIYCKYFMKKEDALIARALPSIICNPYINDNKVTLCVAPSPLYNTAKYLSKKETDFNERFDKFIEDIKNSEDYKDVEIEREYDIPIDPSSISLQVTHAKSNIIDFSPFKFKIKSTHSQKVQCFYNRVMTSELLDFLNIIQDSVIISPNEEKEISVNHLISVFDDKMYPFYLKCYNLPNFINKFETTGLMNKYTYYSSISISDQINEIIGDITINCNEKKNKLNPRCLKEKFVSIIDQLKTEIPENIKKFEEEAKAFAATIYNAKKELISKALEELETIKDNASKTLNDIIENGIKVLKYLTYTDCSIYASGSTNEEDKTIKGEVYLECRQFKQEIVEKIINAIKAKIDNFKCPALLTFIQTDVFTKDFETNLKSLLLFINELSNNPESFKEETSDFLLELIECIEDNFDKYWEEIEKYLKQSKNYLDESIKIIKRDVVNIILQTLENVAKLIHFEELDGYIAKAEEDLTKTGLIIYDKATQIQQKILEFARKLNDFGKFNYTFSGSMFANIETKEGINIDADTETTINYVPDKDIVIITHSNFMFKKSGAYFLQTLSFESPIVSVKAKGEVSGNSDAVNTFVSITLYDKDNNEISFDKIEEKFRPQILYLKSKYDNIKACYYYDEKEKQLYSDGLSLETIIHDGKEYFKCVSSHLTSFTAGTEKVEDSRANNEKGSGSNTLMVVLIILGIILLVAVLVVVFLMLRKRNSNKINNETIDKEINNDGVGQELQ